MFKNGYCSERLLEKVVSFLFWVYARFAGGTHFPQLARASSAGVIRFSHFWKSDPWHLMGFPHTRDFLAGATSGFFKSE